MGFFRDGVDGRRARRYDMLFWQSVGFFFFLVRLIFPVMRNIPVFRLG